MSDQNISEVSPPIEKTNTTFHDECIIVHWPAMKFNSIKAKFAPVSTNFTEVSVELIPESHVIVRRQTGLVLAVGGLSALATHAVDFFLHKSKMVNNLELL